MSIRTKLKLLSLITVIGLGTLAVIIILGLDSIRETEETAHRRQSYVADLLEIKASAVSTIMLDPASTETKVIFSAAGENIGKRGEAAIKVIRRAEIRDQLTQLLGKWADYDRESQKLISMAAVEPKAANEKIIPLYNQEFKPFQAALEKFIAARQDEAEKGMAQARAVSTQTFWKITALLVLVISINLAMVLHLSTSLQSILSRIQQRLIPLRQGDLTQRLPAESKDELGDIARGVNDFVEELQSIVGKTRDRADQLASASLQLAAAAAAVLEITGNQSDATASVATSVEQFSVSIDQVSDNANQAEQKALLSGDLSKVGATEARSAVEEIRGIARVVGDAAQQMQLLGQQARDIGRIVNVIKEVADQTNLLALNAAIEAARAGEAGRGFAVVADEVRKLAERTTSSAQEITDMVVSIQRSTETASAIMESGNALVVKSVKQIEDTGSSMQQINDRSNEVKGATSEISNALREQRIAGVEIARNVEQIAQMTERGRGSAAEVTSAARHLERLAKELQAEVAKFHVVGMAPETMVATG